MELDKGWPLGLGEARDPSGGVCILCCAACQTWCFRGCCRRGSSDQEAVTTTLAGSAAHCSGDAVCVYQHVGISGCSANGSPTRIVTGATAEFSEVLLL